MRQLPSGTVSFLFSDVEGSTQMLERDAAAAGRALARHHEIFEQAVDRHGGAIFETVGDAVYAAFTRPSDAIATALGVQRTLAAEDWGPIGRLAVRIAIHSGQVERRGDHYFGPALFRTARLQSLAWGEQTLLSEVAASMASHSLSDAIQLRDLGTHRLKDLGEPERVFQLVHPELRGDFPPLRSLDPRTHNLPVVPSSFIGREEEIGEVSRLLGAHRLVTLTGTGGTGKTRLALQVAADVVQSFPDGVTFVDLASLRDPGLALTAVAAALGLRERSGEPIGSTLTHHLAGRQQLLVLDNLEQILPGAARDVAHLLGGAPDIRVLATSRAPLRVLGEQEYPVAGLDSGPPQTDRLSPAVALFIQRANEVRPGLLADPSSNAGVAQICSALEGLPLAIELAASRLRLFGLDELHDRLLDRDPRSLGLLSGAGADVPVRQRTMRDTIAWSVELLSSEQRAAFRRLAVFAGPFELRDGEALLADVVGDPLGALESLVDHALLVATDTPMGRRMRMLEPIREYAEEQLTSAGEADAARAAHARWVADMTEDAQARYAGAEHGAALDRIAAYLDDVRSALAWAFDRPEQSLAVRITVATSRYWDERETGEGLRWLERASSVTPLDAATRIQLARRLGWLHSRRGDVDAARRDFEELVRLGIEAGDLEAVDSGRSNLAFTSLTVGRLADAHRHLADLGERSGIENPWSRAITGRLHGRLAAETGDFAAAAAHFRRSEADARASLDQGILASILHDRGMAALWAGDLSSAGIDFSESAQLAREVGFRGVLAPALTHGAVVAARQGDLKTTRAALAESLEEFEELGGSEWLEDLFDAAAWTAHALGRPDAAATLLGAASAQWAVIEPDARATDRQWHAALVDQVRTDVPDAWSGAEASGRLMSAWQAIRFARDLVSQA